jgi:hypothetical protein
MRIAALAVLLGGLELIACASARMEDRTRPPREPLEPLATLRPSIATDAPLKEFRDLQTRWSNHRTTAATWSSEGAFGLSWGMGTGDVKDRVVSLGAFSDTTGHLMAFADDEVESMKALVVYHFQEGRLFGVEIVRRPDLLTSAVPTQEELERWRRESWSWRRRLLEILTAKYGRPNEAPSERDTSCDTEYGGCFTTEMQAWRWIWRRGDTEIELSAGARLRYSNVPAADLAKKADEAARLQWRQGKDAQEKTARERL